MKVISVTSKKLGRHDILVDDQDFDLVSKYNWHINKVRDSDLMYAKTNVYNYTTKKSKGISMHRLILGFPDKVVDHKNNNGLDNRRSNIRTCEQNQNAANQKLIQTNNTTGFRGIVFEPKKKLYRVQIGYKYKRIRGGRFKSIIAAAKKYNDLAIQYFGEFAKLNPIPNE